jgi:hypothetical protein
MTEKKYVPTIAQRIAKESRDLKRLERDQRKESDALRKAKGTPLAAGKESNSTSA